MVKDRPDERLADLSDALAGLSDGELILVFEHQLDGRPSMRSVRDQVATLMACARTVTAVHDEGLLQALVAAPSVKEILEQVRVETSAKQWILKAGTLTTAEVATLTGATGQNPRSKASRMRNQGGLIGLDVGGKKLHPVFQFDVPGGRVRPIVEKVNKILGAREDPWGVASWWVSESGWLPQGESPASYAVKGGHDDRLERIARTMMDEG